MITHHHVGTYLGLFPLNFVSHVILKYPDMVKKFPNKGRLPFKKGSGDSGDPRRFEGAPSTSFEGDNDRRNREPASVYDQLSQTN